MVKRLSLISRVFSRIIVFYMFMIVLLIIFCRYSFVKAIDNSRHQLLERNRIVLSNATQNLLNAFQVIDNQTINLYGFRPLRALTLNFASPADRNIIDIFETIHSLPVFCDSNPLIGDYFVFIPNLELIIAPKQGFIGIEKYYKSHFSISSTQSYADWRNKVLNQPGSTYYASWRDKSEVLFSIGLCTEAEAAKVVYRLLPEAIFRLLSPAYERYAGFAILSDSNGNILSVSEGGEKATETLVDKLPTLIDKSIDDIEVDISGEQFLSSFVNISSHRINIMILIPYSSLLHEAYSSISWIVLLIAKMLGLGLLSLTILLFLSIIPLTPIVKKIPSANLHGYGLHLVNEAFERLETNNYTLRKKLDKQIAFLRNLYVNKLLYESTVNVYDLDSLMHNIGFEIHGSKFAGVIISLDKNQTDDATRTLILEYISDFHSRLYFLSFDSPHMIACLYSENTFCNTDMRLFFSSFREGLQKIINGEVKIYVGIVYDKLIRMPESFQSIEWLRSVSQRNEWLYIAKANDHMVQIKEILSPNKERQLQVSLLQGDTRNLNRLLDEIHHKNFIEKNLQGFHRRYLYCRLIGILAVVLDEDEENCLSNTISDTLFNMNDIEFFSWISNRMNEICHRIQAEGAQKKQKFIHEVCAYIEENYAKYDLSLNSLANNFGVTSNYMSTLFKKSMGKNFSQFVEEVRIARAELLLNRITTIEEVAIQVGYTNSDSFRRAYKRVRGISPSQFRANHISDY